MPYFLGQFRVAVVLVEQADRNLLCGTYYDFTHFVCSHFMAVNHEMDVVLRVGFAHAAWLDFHPAEGAKRTGRLCLAESLVDAKAGQLEELV